ncbi:SgcJ/EcaC family oxidoreductase [Catenuloplanes sp. NPDC051500]|uniref:SgcJ/EcaC family oxidoreductase n=1 Tax=Catenuloplanes sp. NPDC051500 TaxID=3363959 RepID=UPI0037B1959D
MTTTPTAPAALSAEDQAAIAAVPARMIRVWAAHDADEFADLFAEDGTMILPGRYQQGRDAIREFMTHAYAGPYAGTRVTGRPIEMKVLSPGVVAVITEGGVLAAGAEELDAGAAIRASWILVRRDDRWQLAVYQNCPRDPR